MSTSCYKALKVRIRNNQGMDDNIKNTIDLLYSVGGLTEEEMLALYEYAESFKKD